MKRLLAIVCLVIGLLVAVLLALPTILIGFSGGFLQHEVLSRMYDDGTKVVVTKRVAFSATEWIDPAIIVRIEVSKAQKTIASERIRLSEDSDFQRPNVQLTENSIVISHFDRRRNRTITLDRR